MYKQCHFTWETDEPERSFNKTCPRCGSMQLSIGDAE